MTGTVTVEARADPLEKRPRLLQDGRLPPRLDPGRASRRSRRSARPTTSPSTPPRTRRVHRREPRAVRRRRLPLDDRRRPQRRPAGRVRALHPGRRRLRRHPRRRRHRVHVALVRPDARAATSATTRPARRPRRSTSRTPTSPPRRAFPPAGRATDEWYNFQSPANPVVNGGGADYSPRNSGVHVLATVDESTYDEDDGNAGARRPPDRVVHELRRRPLLVHGHGPHAGLVRRGRLPRAPPRRPPDRGRRRRGRLRRAARAAARARPTSRRSRSTTTRRTRWSSTSPLTGASSTSSATAA